jgi:hypothetical protein
MTCRNIPLLIASLSLFVAASVGCGDDGGSDEPGQQETASSTAETSASFATLKDSPEDEAALSNVSALPQLAKGLAQFGVTDTPTQPFEGTAESIVEDSISKALRSQAQLGDCVSTSGTTYTYELCEVGAFIISGEVSVNGNLMSINLTLDAQEDELNALVDDYGLALGTDLSSIEIVSFVADIQATDLTVTPTLINGQIDFSDTIVTAIEVDGSTEEIPNETTFSATYNSVEYDADRCAVGGTLVVDIVSGGTQILGSQPVEASYGPTCGDVTVTQLDE